jgi:thiamine-phosphate pyrophosphorylase
MTKKRTATKIPRTTSAKQTAADSCTHRIDMADISFSHDTYRAMDANLNRVVEGLRVAEDLLRFGGAGASDISALRALRHDARAGARLLPGGASALLTARDARGDSARAAASGPHASASDVATANLKRAQEGLRVLEELARAVSQRAARHFAELRFRAYDAEKDAAPLLATLGRRNRMPAKHFLYAIADFDTLRARKWAFLSALLDLDSCAIQLRDTAPDITDTERLRRAEMVRLRITNSSNLLIMNNRADIAAAAGADGVHLGQHDLPVARVRALFGPGLILGVSTHNDAEFDAALHLRPDYIAVGAMFRSPTKPNVPVSGLSFLKNSVKRTDIPLVAIGGITPANLPRVLASGARGAAMISSLKDTSDLTATVRGIKRTLDRASKVAAKNS